MLNIHQERFEEEKAKRILETFLNFPPLTKRESPDFQYNDELGIEVVTAYDKEYQRRSSLFVAYNENPNAALLTKLNESIKQTLTIDENTFSTFKMESNTSNNPTVQVTKRYNFSEHDLFLIKEKIINKIKKLNSCYEIFKQMGLFIYTPTIVPQKYEMESFVNELCTEQELYAKKNVFAREYDFIIIYFEAMMCLVYIDTTNRTYKTLDNIS